jgi:RNA polymerase sigma factor (sigma-70 family)
MIHLLIAFALALTAWAFTVAAWFGRTTWLGDVAMILMAFVAALVVWRGTVSLWIFQTAIAHGSGHGTGRDPWSMLAFRDEEDPPEPAEPPSYVCPGSSSEEPSHRNKPVTKEHARELIFCDESYSRVVKLLGRLRIPESYRADLAQDAFFSAYATFHTYDPQRGSPERWLNAIVVHTASKFNALARHRREVLAEDDDALCAGKMEDEDSRADALLQSEQERLWVLDTIHDIDPHLRAVLIAHDIDGRPMREIAEQCGMPCSTAYKLRSRAIAALANLLSMRKNEIG